MRNFLTIILISAVGMFTITGCVEKKPTLPDFTMSATIGTNGFSTNACTATTKDGALAIIGKNGQKPVITIWLVNYNGGMGTTVISDPVATNAIITYTPNDSSGQVVASGAITITSTAGTDISGTFYGTLTDGTAITDGKFIAEKL